MADDYIPYNGQVLRTGNLVPPVKGSSLPLLSAAPGFKVWTRSEIEEAIKLRPMKRREQFAGKDWILNQANRGSCNAAAATGALRRTMVLGGRNDVPQLAWEFLYAQINGGQDNGSMLDDGMNAITRIGIPLLNLQKHPLNRDILKSKYTPEEYAQAKEWRAETCYQTDDPLELATAILGFNAAGVVAVHVGSSFTSLDKNGYVGVDHGPGNHAVGVSDVELINGKLAFDHNGSWGVDMHDHGYGYLDWDAHLAQTSRNHQFYVIIGATNPGTH